MSKLYYRFGAMNCGKSAMLMQVAHNYEENGKHVLVIKPAIDSKGNDKVVSRIGLERCVDILLKNDESLTSYYSSINGVYDCILVDEAQFLTENQVDELWYITKFYNIPVICYGLKIDFKGNFFTGSKRLFELGDEFEELVTVCSCGKKAKFNARFVDDEFTLDGDQVEIDGAKQNVVYRPKCGYCYLKLKKSIKK